MPAPKLLSGWVHLRVLLGHVVALGALAFAVVPASAANYALGADIGWLSQMEASGVKFRNAAGLEQDCLQVLQEVGINSLRLRVWVNPADGWCGEADVVAQAARAQRRGLRLMIDFHYSDAWADPGKQNKPAAWAGHDLAQLRADVQAHTTHVLQALKSAGVAPEWVQIGNETNDGMLWNDGRASTAMGSFASLITSGYDAVKAVFPDTKVLVHISNGYDSSLFRWMFDGLTAQGAKFDVIAMSLYPSPTNWATLNAQCLANMNDMVARYGKEVMISEVGMSVSSAAAGKAFLADLIAKNQSLPDGRGLGVFYWEPESYNRWQGYTLGAFGSNGSPTEAMDAFAVSAPPVSGQPKSIVANVGGAVNLTVAGTFSPSYQWRKDGANLAGATTATLTLAGVQPSAAGLYTAAVTTSATVLSDPAIVGVATLDKVAGAGVELGKDIFVSSNGNTFDQVLLQGAAATITADPGQITRVSFVDLTDDIVQVEFSGAGTLSIVLDDPSGPAPAVNYDQPSIAYMKGHAGIVIAGANETTNVAVFSVGRITAVNPALFKSDVNYDGSADIAYVAILSIDGKFGGIRSANAHYVATRGLTGVYAPGVQFSGPVYVGNIVASDAAQPVLILGSATNTQVTGGDLLQANGQPVQVKGLSQLRFSAGTTSHGRGLPAQANRARLVQDGSDVTDRVVVDPSP